MYMYIHVHMHVHVHTSTCTCICGFLHFQLGLALYILLCLSSDSLLLKALGDKYIVVAHYITIKDIVSFEMIYSSV